MSMRVSGRVDALSFATGPIFAFFAWSVVGWENLESCLKAHFGCVIRYIPDLFIFGGVRVSETSLGHSVTCFSFIVNGEMGVTKEQVEASLTSKMNPSHLEIIDTSGGCGASFAIEIVSEQFEGKKLLERHRMINSALAEEMQHIHALSIKKALTPTQWKQQQESISTPPSSQ